MKTSFFVYKKSLVTEQAYILSVIFFGFLFFFAQIQNLIHYFYFEWIDIQYRFGFFISQHLRLSTKFDFEIAECFFSSIFISRIDQFLEARNINVANVLCLRRHAIFRSQGETYIQLFLLDATAHII